MTVKNKEQAFAEANKIMKYDYEYDQSRSHNAGYDIYFTTHSGVNEWISDLGNRLEVNLWNGKTVNIWIEKTFEEEMVERGFHKNILGVWVA